MIKLLYFSCGNSKHSKISKAVTTLMEMYNNPLITRYASQEMSALFSDEKKFRTWRALWVYLAESQKELGLDITDAQVSELQQHQDILNLEIAKAKESEIKHDVLAHIYAFGEQCPHAKPIIHLGATSCFVTDNADQIMQREALLRVRTMLVNVIDALATFANENKSVPCLGFTHLQPAQPTTVGKRATLWAQDFLFDLQDVEQCISQTLFRSTKGTTGTQASFLKLLGSPEKVRELENKVAKKAGFSSILPVSGQTYSRKLDSKLMNVLAGIAESAHKFSTDIRLLASKREIEEPFGAQQKGSSAMAYKRNPMRSERISSLARYVMVLPQSLGMTHATQWLERTLDDSALRRIVIPQGFLSVDAILRLCSNVASGLVVNTEVIKQNLAFELPFMATENILMECVKRGSDRQVLHTVMRDHSIAAAQQIKQGGANDLLSRIAADPNVPLQTHEIAPLVNVSEFVGCAPMQVEQFIQTHVEPMRKKYDAELGEEVDIKV